MHNHIFRHLIKVRTLCVHRFLPHLVNNERWTLCHKSDHRVQIRKTRFGISCMLVVLSVILVAGYVQEVDYVPSEIYTIQASGAISVGVNTSESFIPKRVT
jgi:hypothetical protein